MPKNSKDFDILLRKVTTSNTKKDISVVSGYNMIVQQIEQVCKSNQGELMADPYFGSNVYQYIYDNQYDKNLIELFVTNSIQYGVKSAYNVIVKMTESNSSYITFNIKFSLGNSVNNQKTIECNIEVPIK